MAQLYRLPVYRIRNSLIPIALCWAASFAFVAYLDVKELVPRWLLLAITAPIGVVAVLHLFHSIVRVVWAIKAYGRHLPGLILRMASLSPKLARFRFETAKLSLHIGFAMLGLTVALWSHAPSVLPMAALAIGIAVAVALRLLLPPAGVYLASSDPERVRFFGRLSRGTIQQFAALLEVSNLVDPSNGVKRWFFDQTGALSDCRTSKPGDWPSVVTSLVEMAVIVLVDGRDQTAGVEFEVKRILRNRLDVKTAFLSEDGQTPSVLTRLEAKPSDASRGFWLLSHEDALRVVPLMLWDPKVAWVPVQMDA